jgi:DNA-binding GntR family transcriptional regulator
MKVTDTPKETRKPVRRRVYEHLKAEILTGRLSPEERLGEEHLAEILGVSRTPVREALHKLETEGLIQPGAKRGFIVSGDSREEVEDRFEIRAVLEGYALRIISARIGEEHLKRLEDLTDWAEAALEANRMDEVFDLNTRFHDTLHELVADRERFFRLIVDMRKQVLRYRKETLQSREGARRTINGHRRIVLTLHLKDPDLCERTMREHIRQAKEDALQAIMGQVKENV